MCYKTVDSCPRKYKGLLIVDEYTFIPSQDAFIELKEKHEAKIAIIISDTFEPMQLRIIYQDYTSVKTDFEDRRDLHMTSNKCFGGIKSGNVRGS